MSQPEPQVEKRAVSPAMRRRVIAEQDGICARSYCEAPATDVDHILPLWLKGKNDRANLEGLCADCHAVKTKAEAKARAKCKRLAGETKSAPPARPLKGRGFGSVSRGFDGKVKLTAKARREAASNDAGDEAAAIQIIRGGRP